MAKQAATMVKAPDGGWGWVIVASSFLIHVVMDGMTYSFGVLAAEFVDDLGSTRQLNGWITSVLVGVSLGAGPVVSVLCVRFGHRAVTIAGAVLAWAGFAVSYFVTQPWMFILTISLLAGFGISLIYLPAIVSVGMYFEKRRSTAIGIAVCGSGLGIFVFGPFIHYLIDEYTWRGAVLILSGIVLNCAVFGSLLRPLPVTASAAASAAAASAEDAEETQPLTAVEERCEGAGGESAMNDRADVRGDDARRQTRHPSCEFRSLQVLDQQPRRQGRLRTCSTGVNLDESMAATPQVLPPLPPQLLLLPSRSAFVLASALSLASAAATAQQPGQEDDNRTEPSSAASPGKLASILAAIRYQASKLVKLKLLKDPAFLLFILSNLLFNVGFDAPFLYTPDRAQQAGHTAKSGSLLLSVIGIANLIGRLVFGFVSDRKEVNKPILYAFALTIADVALFFSFISSAYAFMAVYCAVFGVFVGAYITLTPAVLADLLGAENLNDSFGLTLLFQGIGVLAGPPMAGAIFDHTNSFNISYMSSGSCMMLSGIILFPLPCLLSWQAANGKRACNDPVTVELQPDSS